LLPISGVPKAQVAHDEPPKQTARWNQSTYKALPAHFEPAGSRPVTRAVRVSYRQLLA